MLFSTKFSLVYLVFAIFSLTGVGMVMFQEEEPPEEAVEVLWEITEPEGDILKADTDSQISTKGTKPDDENGRVRLFRRSADGTEWIQVKHTKSINNNLEKWGRFSWLRTPLSHWPTPGTAQFGHHSYRIFLESKIGENDWDYEDELVFRIERTIL